jgi:hypothetical protein
VIKKTVSATRPDSNGNRHSGTITRILSAETAEVLDAALAPYNGSVEYTVSNE